MLTAQRAQLTARIGGLAYLAIFVLAIVANFFVLEPLFAPGEPEETAANIAGAAPLFRAGVAAFMAVLIADIVVGWALFVVLRPADAEMAVLALLFRLAYAIAHIAIVSNLMSALSFATAPSIVAPLGEGAPALSYHFFATHRLGFTATLIFFGAHLLLLGWLIAKSGYMPRLLGGLVSLSGLAYLADGFATILLGGYGAYAEFAALAMVAAAFAGEGALTGWLIARGVDTQRFSLISSDPGVPVR